MDGVELEGIIRFVCMLVRSEAEALYSCAAMEKVESFTVRRMSRKGRGAVG